MGLAKQIEVGGVDYVVMKRNCQHTISYESYYALKTLKPCDYKQCTMFIGVFIHSKMLKFVNSFKDFITNINKITTTPLPKNPLDNFVI